MEALAANGELEQWDALRAKVAFPNLLLGNGASLAVWRKFSYFSLFDEAQTIRNRPLTQTELSLFRALDTDIFEQVLSALRRSLRVNAALTINTSSPRNRYFAIKEALIHAIRSVHIPWSLMPGETLASLNHELQQYRTVFSGNYDLLTYWAVQNNPARFDSLFRGTDSSFDPTNTQPQDDSTRVFYLHGGLHLVKNADGSTRLLNSSESTLLASFAVNQLGDVPLFVNESSSADKLRSIRNSDYLAYGLGQLGQAGEGLCIFGHTLGKQDQHLLHAIQQACPKALAISIYPHNSTFIQQQKAYYTQLFAGQPQIELHFFNSQSHPLGHPQLRVAVPKTEQSVTH